jgi:hypothetical protein
MNERLNELLTYELEESLGEIWGYSTEADVAPFLT